MAEAKYVLRDLPGIVELENDIVLANRLGGVGEALLERIDAVSRQLFGITHEEARPAIPDDGDDTGMEAYDAAWEKLEAIDVEECGWDIADERGRELLVAEYFDLQISAVMAGLGGHLPGQRPPGALSADEETYAERKLAAERAKFEAAKRTRPKDRD